MKYTGINARDFERDARVLIAKHQPMDGAHEDQTFLDDVTALRLTYGIGEAEIWDILPEYDYQALQRKMDREGAVYGWSNE